MKARTPHWMLVLAVVASPLGSVSTVAAPAAPPAEDGAIPLYGDRTPGATTTLMIDQFTAWLQMQGFLARKDSK